MYADYDRSLTALNETHNLHSFQSDLRPGHDIGIALVDLVDDLYWDIEGGKRYFVFSLMISF